MFSKWISVSLFAAMLTTASVSQADHNGHGNSLFTNENIGRAVGTGLGAYLGSKVGKGRGNDAAIAAGAVGGFVLGGKVGRDWRSNKRSHYRGHSSRARVKSNRGYLEPVLAMPDLEEIDATFYANRTSNVRGGPSTKYKIVEGLQRGEEVRVLGRVVEKNWYMIAQNDIIQGFVHMSLLEPTGERYSYSSNY
ncbi:MAG: SH3 domain-containing protein [Granulosicoccus sp.]|nr:SH3 domain-containing protein [Granulosicoccus sp.]